MSGRPLDWLVLRWPRQISVEQVVGVFRVLASSAGSPVVVQTTGSARQLTHYLAVGRQRQPGVVEQLRALVPGIGVEVLDAAPVLGVEQAVQVRTTTRRRPLVSREHETTARGLVTALATALRDEVVVLQWLLVNPLSPVAIPNKIDHLPAERWTDALLRAPFSAPPNLDGELRSAMRAKQGEPGWRAVARIGVKATTPARRRLLIGQVVGALRASEGPGVRLYTSATRRSAVERASVPCRLPLAINIVELSGLAGWPIGSTSNLPVAHIDSQVLAPTAAVPSKGRVIGEATFPGSERPLAISPDDSLRHVHLLGPTGTGKSTLLLSLIDQDIATGRGVVVIEPKGDLVKAVLGRIPKERVDDVVIIDPTDVVAPVGINPLHSTSASSELVADDLLSVFHQLYAAHWGPRTQDILHASLLTLAKTPGMTLVALPLLLTDARFRRTVVARVHDPIGVGPFWSAFEQWSDAERTVAIAPVLNKVRPLLLRTALRRIIGQAEPRFELRQVFTERKIVLVNLARGQLGIEASALLGSLVVAQLWQAAQSRSAIDVRRRHPVMVYLDEFQQFLHLPTDLADALATSRSLGVAWHLAHQHLGQLDPTMKAAVLANARSRICFQLPADDARVMANTSTVLSADDFQSLGAFQFYAQLMARGAVQPWCSGRSIETSGTITNEGEIHTASRRRYGRPVAEIDAAIEALVSGQSLHDQSNSDLAPRRRRRPGDGPGASS